MCLRLFKWYFRSSHLFPSLWQWTYLKRDPLPKNYNIIYPLKDLNNERKSKIYNWKYKFKQNNNFYVKEFPPEGFNMFWVLDVLGS